MKRKLSPISLGAVVLGCVAALGLALWVLGRGADESAPTPDLPTLELSNAPGSHPAESVAPAAHDAGDAASDERVALEGAPAESLAPQVEYALREEDGRPLASARAALFRGEEFLGARRADEQGIVRFDASEGSARLALAPRGKPASVRDVPTTAGHHAVVLERGVAVAGRTRVLGASSHADVELLLLSDRPMVDDSSWPAEVRKALDLDQRDKLRLSLRTDALGTFEFTGLGSPWSGRLEVGDGHEIAAVSAGDWTPGNDTLRLDDPLEGLVIDVIALPLAVGRIVQSPGGPGVPRANVGGQLRFETFGESGTNAGANFDGRTRDDGTFALPVHPRGSYEPEELTSPTFWPPVSSITLTLDGGEGYPRRRLELERGQFPARGEGGTWDFGELVLDRGAILAFHVADAEGKPLAGAVGRLDGERSEPTDEAGDATIAYAVGVSRPLVVSLDGYRDARAPVPEDASQKLSLTLERANRLTVDVRTSDGAPVVDVPVQLSSLEGGGQRPNRRGNRMNEQRTDGRGRVTFTDFPADTPLRLMVRDAMGAAASDQKLTLGAEEWRSIEVTLDRALLSFAGVVRDEQGLPLAEAAVEFFARAGQARNAVSTRSDADGRFSFGGLPERVGVLRARKTGFAPVTISPFELPPPGAIVDIRLERGLRIVLRIVDERGAPVAGESLRLELAGERPLQGRKLTANEWQFGSLPREPLVAVGSVGRREYRQEVDPLNGDQDFRVPVHGALDVELRMASIAANPSLRMVLRARTDRRVAFTRELEANVLQEVHFGPLLPGDYVIEVVQYETTGKDGVWLPLGAPARVEVAAGGTTRFSLER